MSNKNYENQILDAIQLLVDSAISKANFDKTIKGIVSKCTDQSKGEYVIKYQDSSFYAYSNDLEQVYSSGTSVYVLVPNNDMAQTKTILGSVNKLGSDYINVKENIDDYQTIGNSIISTNQEFGVCSYVPGGDAIVLYDKVNNIDLIDVNEFAANAYLKQSNYLIVGADFRTALDNNQKYKGNYGLAFKLAFLDPITNENVSRTYLVDVNAMTGNPYEYINKSEQRVVFEIDGQNFEEIETITLFSYNFPNQDEEIQSNDIFASGLILEGANLLTEEEIGGNALIITTPQGIYFDENDLMTAHRDIIAEVRINNKIIPANSDALQYYWFRENPKINSNSEKYNRYGGNGWECLNSFNNLGTNEADQPIIDWLSAQSSYVTTKASNPAKETDYKCIVVYNKELILSKTITIFNYSSLYNITIESNTGTYFSYNNGKPTLTATINGDAPSEYVYKWSIIDNNNRFNTLEETTALNVDYHTKQNRYDEIKNGLNDGSILLTAAIQTELSDLMYSLQKYEKTMRVESNIIYNLNLNTITNFSIFICSVYDAEDNYLGKGKIEIINDINGDANAYTLVINNGDQVFKYNEQGVAPTSKSLENPQEIYPLSFTLYDENGLEISNNLISANNVSWTVPTTETMINISDVHGNPSEVDTLNETKTYTGYKELFFDIPTIYSANKKRNTIELKVKYKNKVVIVKKELTFIKEGEVGTNGTNYICKIIPNVLGTAEIPKYVIYRYNNTTNVGSLNYEPAGEGLWFKAQLYKDGVNIFNGTASGNSSEGKAVTIEWSMLINKYDNTHSDLSNFAINNGLFSFIDANKDIDNPANIVKCTITYENQTYYATIPIIYVNAAAPYKAEPIESTGFQYAMYTTDGTRPIYDTTNPFALKITQAINNVDTDISITTDSQYALDDYDWSVEGEVYSAGSPIAQSNLIRRTITIDNLAKNEAKFYPIEKFDGFCVNNGLLCKISRNSEILLKIHLPIHLYLNRYGNSALNGWDGNHIEINDEGGFILAPQIGAGKKEADNSYTGVFMGTVREAGSNKEEVGLFGYNSGVRTIELDAEDGSAKFGREGQGQIIISPDEKNDHSVIKSGGYIPPVLDTHGNIITPGQGLEIDLTDPHITFGSGNFRVDKDGNVSAIGFATISQLEAGNINIPGVENWKTISATDNVQFEVNSQYYPAANASKNITCQCSYKDEIVNGYTATLVNSSGSSISNPSTINGITIQVSKNSSSNDTIITFSVNQSAKITNATNTFYVKFTHTASNLSIIKAFYVNLIILGQDGAKGEQGPAGPAGKDGTSVTIKGSYDTLAQLIAAHPSGNTLGDGYVIGLNLYVYTNAGGGGGSQTSDWNDVGQFKGEDAKRCFIVASSEVFKSTNNGATYIPASATITPYLQAVSFNSWAYDKNDGSGYRPLSGTLPTGITINNNIVTVANNSEIFDTTDTVLFKCTTDNNEVYDIITITRVKDGANGADGRGISSITNYYLATSASSGVTRDTTGWTTDVQTMTATNQYLWNYEDILYTNNTHTYTNPVIIGRYGQNGAAGKGITSIVEYYAINNSTTAPADSAFGTQVVAPTADNKYLWNYELITYNNPTSTSKTDKRIIGTYGRDGTNGTSPYFSYLTNETQSFVYGKAATATTQLYGYQGTTEKTVQIKTINGVAVATTDTATGKTGMNFKVSSTSAASHPTITFTTTTALPQGATERLAIVYRVTGESADRTIYFSYSTTTRGATGAAAVVYDVEPSVYSVVKKIDDTFAPTTVTFYGYSKTGSNARAAYAGRWLIQYSVNGTSWTTAYTGSTNESSKTYTIPTNISDIKLIKAYLSPSGATPTTSNALDSQSVSILNDSEDIEIGGRNLLLKSNAAATTPSSYQIMTYNISDYGKLTTDQVYTLSLNFTASEERKGINCYVGGGTYDIGPWKSIPEAGTYTYIWTFTASSSMASASQFINVYSSTTGGAQGSTQIAGTCEVNWIKLEAGNVATDWTPAPEDVDSAIEDVQDIANAAYAQAQSTLITYTTTDTANAPSAQAVWVSNLPSAPDKYIWQRIEYKFLDSTRDYSTQPTCIYTPTRITNELQYCLCSTNNYSDNAKTNDWQSESFPWDDSYYTSAGVGNITINRYQFVRNKYTDTNKEEDAVTYSTPILDQSWYMFGYKLASEAVAREALASSINNNIVEINGQNGVTISSANAQYGIRLTSVGLQFLLNGDWTTVWNINGILDANLITVKDLRADNILSGTLTLNTTDNNGSFVLNSTYGESSRIDENGIKVTTSDGATVHIKAGAGEGISAKTQSNVEYFNVDPDTQQTTMKNSQVDNTLGLGTNIKVVQITHGVAFIGIYTNGS